MLTWSFPESPTHDRDVLVEVVVAAQSFLTARRLTVPPTPRDGKPQERCQSEPTSRRHRTATETPPVRLWRYSDLDLASSAGIRTLNRLALTALHTGKEQDERTAAR